MSGRAGLSYTPCSPVISPSKKAPSPIIAPVNGTPEKKSLSEGLRHTIQLEYSGNADPTWLYEVEAVQEG